MDKFYAVVMLICGILLTYYFAITPGDQMLIATVAGTLFGPPIAEFIIIPLIEK